MSQVCFRIFFVVTLAVCSTRAAQPPDDGPVAHGWSQTILEENDLFVKTDRHYTQGIKVTLMPPEIERRDGDEGSFAFVPTWGFKDRFAGAGFAIGQNIYTPRDISVPTLLPDDRPYAGWLYFSTMFHRRGETPRGNAVLESLELELGVVGPGSLAKEAQIWVHELRGFALPQGWSNQLRNEPGVRLKLLRAHRWRGECGAGLAIDAIPQFGLSLGTVENSAQIGGTIRAGLHLPDDFGVRTIDALTSASGGYDSSWNHLFGAYVYAGAVGKAVAQNIFLDGNLYHTSHHVSKDTYTGDFLAGFVLVFRRFEIGYTQTFRTDEFSAQNEHDRFGSVYLKMKL